MSRFLVTTALEKTWPADDVPVLFLGEWCRLYDRKPAWEKRDAIVAPYHWDDRRKLHHDYLYLQKIYEELLGELAVKLNALHGVNHSIRYWRIIIGPWLGYFVPALFDRWAMLRQVARENGISGVRVIEGADSRLVPNDMADFFPMLIGGAWNEAICGQLLALMDVPVEKVDTARTARDAAADVVKPGFSRKTKRILIQLAAHVSGAFCREKEYFFIRSYLPVKFDLLLQLRLGQVPKVWRAVEVKPYHVNNSMRQWERPKPENTDDFAAIARFMIPRHIPKAYLEGYRELSATVENLPWPKQPKAIFTSASYFSDDTFKVWAANKVETGIPLIMGQHGGNFGMALWGFEEDHQIASSDRYLTWGWSKPEEKKVMPVGNLKCFGERRVWDKNGDALLVEMALPQFSYYMFSGPVAGQWLDYFEEQIRFVRALPEDLRDRLIVRLYSHDYGWAQKRRWQERCPEVRLDEGTQSMASLVRKSRLYISTYNATTYLESMSLNIPTIIFWKPEHWELRDSAIPFFEQLKSVGIFHDTPEDAARHMAAVWDDVAGWWESAAVQMVRREFCARYTQIPENPLKVMSTLFREIAATPTAHAQAGI